MTLYAAAIRLLGLSQTDAAGLHGVSLNTVKSWAASRNPVPLGVWDELRSLYALQMNAADEALDEIDRHPQAEVIDLLTNTDRAAEWPSEGAHMAVLARVALEIDKPVT